MSVNLSEVLEGLLEARVDFILVGGLAAVIQGAPVTTMDVDVVHRQSPENIARLLSFLKSIDAVHRRLDDRLIEPKERDLSGKGHVLLATRIGPLDLKTLIELKETSTDPKDKQRLPVLKETLRAACSESVPIPNVRSAQ